MLNRYALMIPLSSAFVLDQNLYSLCCALYFVLYKKNDNAHLTEVLTSIIIFSWTHLFFLIFKGQHVKLIQPFPVPLNYI